MIDNCKVPGAREPKEAQPTVFIHRENREEHTTDAVSTYLCPICSQSIPNQGTVVGSHLCSHIHELHNKIFLLEWTSEGQVGELMRAVKENLERALEAEAEADELRAAIADLGESG